MGSPYLRAYFYLRNCSTEFHEFLIAGLLCQLSNSVLIGIALTLFRILLKLKPDVAIQSPVVGKAVFNTTGSSFCLSSVFVFRMVIMSRSQ